MHNRTIKIAGTSHKWDRWLVGLIAMAMLSLLACADAATATPLSPQPTSTPTPAQPSGSQADWPVVPRADSDAAQPEEVPQQPGGAAGFSHFLFEQVGDQVVTSLVEGPRGPQVRVAYSFPALQQLLAAPEPIPQGLQMDRADLEILVGQLDAIRAATEKYQDVRLALADGYEQATDVVPNMGAHFIHDDRVLDGALNVEEPEVLIYDLNEAGDWHLRGTSFVLPWPIVGDDHPEGFAGPLDNWHVHYDLCIGSELDSRTAQAQDCVEAGGEFIPTYGWMIHAWVHDDNPLGVFSMWNSNVPPFVPVESIRSLREAVSLPSDGTSEVDGSTGPDTTTVTIVNFEHSTIEIEVGRTVTWVNSDGVPHTVTAGSSGVLDGTFDSGLLGSGQAFIQSFDQEGRFPFTCQVHPQMNGTVVVIPSRK